MTCPKPSACTMQHDCPHRWNCAVTQHTVTPDEPKERDPMMFAETAPPAVIKAGLVGVVCGLLFSASLVFGLKWLWSL